MRRLTLQRELLSVLSTDELANVAGAAAEHTTPIAYCVLSAVMGPCQYTSPCTS